MPYFRPYTDEFCGTTYPERSQSHSRKAMTDAPLSTTSAPTDAEVRTENPAQTSPPAEGQHLPPWWRHFEGRELPDTNFAQRSLQSYLDEAAERSPERKAVIFQNYTLTYSQLREKAENFAAALRLRGVQSGDRVALMLPNIPQTVIAIWGVLKAGAVAVMTNPLYMEKELTHHFEDSEARILVTLDLLWPKIAALRSKLNLRLCVVTRVADGLSFPLSWLQPWKAKREGHLPEVPYDDQQIIPWRTFMNTRERFAEDVENPAETLAFLQYTGGTTGFSKAAMLTHQNFSAQMQILESIIGAPEDKRYTFLSILPFFHVFGLAGNVLLPTLYAAATIPVPRYTPGDLLRTIDKYRPNFFIGTPSVYISLMQQKDIAKYNLRCIEMCISGSAPFPLEAMRRFQDITGTNLTEGFGLTEASPCVTANPIYGLQKTGSIGVALPGTEVRITDLETGERVLGDNEVGELSVRGPQVMQGYWNRQDESAATLRDGWLYTGDIAYRDADGYYFIVDRKKDMAIVGGYNVYPREIDEVLYEHPKVAEAVAVGVPHQTRGEILKAYVVTKPGETLTVPELVTHCREKLANYKVPKFFEFREELPKTMVGKVLRRVLREEEERKLREKAGEMAGKAREKAEELAGDFKEKAGEISGKAREKAGELAEDFKEKAGEMVGHARELAGEVAGKAEHLREQAGEMVGHAKEKAREKAGEVSRAFSENVDKAMRTVRKEGKDAPAAPSPDTATLPSDTPPEARTGAPANAPTAPSSAPTDAPADALADTPTTMPAAPSPDTAKSPAAPDEQAHTHDPAKK